MAEVEGEVDYEHFVHLRVTGSPGILKQPFTALARLDSTWNRFLTGCGVMLSPEDGVYVRTKNLRTVHGETKWGWSAELTEPVRNFVGNFERKRKLYTVRLLSRHGRVSLASGVVRTPKSRAVAATPKPKSASSSATKPKSASASATKPKSASTSAIGSTPRSNAAVDSDGYRRPRYIPGLSVSTRRRGQGVHSGTRLQSKMPRLKAPISIGMREKGRRVFLKRGRPVTPGVQGVVKVEVESPEIEVLELNNACTGEENNHEGNPATSESNNERDPGSANDEDINDHVGDGTEVAKCLSVCLVEEDDDDMSNAADQDDELGRRGIQNEDVKSLVQRNLRRFDNSFLLKVKNEIEKLEAGNLWIRNVSRSPYSCYFLQELRRGETLNEDLALLAERNTQRIDTEFLLIVQNEIEKLEEENLWIKNVSRSPYGCYFLRELFKK